MNKKSSTNFIKQSRVNGYPTWLTGVIGVVFMNCNKLNLMR